MRYGTGMLGKMYMNAMDMDMELRGTVNMIFGSQLSIEVFVASLSDQAVGGRAVPKTRFK